MATPTEPPSRTTASATFRPNWPLLAGVRFALAFAVVMIHMAKLDYQVPGLWLQEFGAPACVSAFFLISGYSIAHSIAREPQGFIRRRFWRIWPIYLCVVAMAVIPFLMMGHGVLTGVSAMGPDGGRISAPPLSQVLGQLTMLNTWVTPTAKILTPTWTLSIEFMLYMAAPWFARLTRAGLMALICASILLFLWHTQAEGAFVPSAGPAVPLSMAWIWLAGWMLYHQSERVRIRIAWIALPFSLIGFALGGLVAAGPVAVGLTVVALCAGHRLRLGRGFAKILTFLGDLSYPLYVCHFSVGYIYFWLTGSHNGDLCLALATLISLALLVGVDHSVRTISRAKRRKMPGIPRDALQAHSGT